MRKKPRILKDIAQPAPMWRYPDATLCVQESLTVQHHAPHVGAQQPGDRIDHRRFARARAAEKRGDATFGAEGQIQIEPVKAVAQRDLKHQRAPEIRLATRRAKASESSTAASATNPAKAAMAKARFSPPGTCKAVQIALGRVWV